MLQRFLYALIALTLPLTLWAGRITAVDCAQHAKNNFFILVLHFDQETAYQLDELNSGYAARLTATNCDVDPAAATKLAGINNELLKSVKLAHNAVALNLELNFSTIAEVRVREAKDPFSLILDISTSTKSSAKTKPPQQQPADVNTPAAKSDVSKTVQSSPKNRAELPANKKFPAPEQRKEAKTAHTENQLGENLSPRGHFDRGMALNREGQYQAALEHFKKASADSELFGKATAELANIYRQLGRTSDAIVEWEKFFSTVEKPKADENLYAHGQPAAQSTPQIVKYETPPTQRISSAQGNSAAASSSARGLPPIEKSNDSHLGLYFLYFLIAVLLTVIYFLHRSNKELHRKILMLLQHGSEEREEEEESSQVTQGKENSVPELEDQVAPPDFLIQDETPPPLSEELGQEEPESSSNTIQEVCNLNLKGLSTQEIAEKLGLGQDEVRLILNLQRDEKNVAGAQQ